MAQTGIARAIYPVHTPLDGDVVFAAATGQKAACRSAAELVAARRRCRQCDGAGDRARVYEATALPFAGALPSWRDKFGSEQHGASALTVMPSTVIRNFSYNVATRQLSVTFVTGRVYAYASVPPDVHNAFRASGSQRPFL